MLEALSLKLDGKRAAAKTVNRKRAVLFNALEYAHELKLLTANRLSEVKWTVPKSVRAIDKRVVINPRQAKSLLSEVEAQRIEGQPRRSSGRRWSRSSPSCTTRLSDHRRSLDRQRRTRDRRQLKQRGKGEIAVLHQIYAKVIASLESAAHDRIERALGWES
ncbi:hypothetical protein PV458_35825 [Streptomyces sp. MN03-5084-2B]|nr:hypothetical protein [Streptomyces sp. MN03-5084-2B]